MGGGLGLGARQWRRVQRPLWLGLVAPIPAPVALLSRALLPGLMGYSAFAVYGGSMEPTIAKGSVAFVKPVAPDTLREGDVMVYSPSPASGPAPLNWTATPDTYASGHRVLRSTTSGGPYSQIAEITPRTTTTYVDSVCAGTYYYVARTYFQNWESANSNQATGTGAGSSSSYATIAFRSAASAGAGSGVLTLTISKPAGTVSGDVMIAAVGVRQNTGVSTVTATITPPPP